jgi:hypothetical protein
MRLRNACIFVVLAVLTSFGSAASQVGDAAGPMTQAFAAACTNALAFAFGPPPSATLPGSWTISEYRTTDAGGSWQTRPLQP